MRPWVTGAKFLYGLFTVAQPRKRHGKTLAASPWGAAHHFVNSTDADMIAFAHRLGVLFRLVLALALTMGMSLSPIAAAPAYAGLRPIDEAKYAAIVIDADSGEVLYARRADSPRYPASIT